MDMNSSEEKSEITQVEIVTMSPPNFPKCPFNLSLHNIKGKIQKRSPESPTKSSASSSQIKKNTKLTFKDQQMHKRVFQQGGLPDGSLVAYYSHGIPVLQGYKWQDGILCLCCHEMVSPSRFEAHAGQKSRKKPYGNIFTSTGVSLHEYASSMKLTCGHLSKNDELCGICRNGGDLLLCDGCPRSFHKECVDETNSWPLKKWFCKYCRNSMKNVVQNYGVDPIKQIEKCCIQMVYNPDECELVACSICRAYNFSKTGFNDQTVIVCDQCEKEYHIGCLRAHKNVDLKELPPGNWFCTLNCGILHSVLAIVVKCGPEKVPHSLLGSITKKPNDNNINGIGIGITDSDMQWIVVRGKDASGENKKLLAQSIKIFHKGFNPIVDLSTGSDFIPSMAKGSIMGASDFSGVHCAMLTIKSKVVTAGMFRVFGADIAELPIAATSVPHQGKGYFKLFFNCFERLMAYLKVKKIVVPAAEGVKSMWIHKLGFEKVTPNQLSEYQQTFTSMVAFHGTRLLEKEVSGGGGVTFEDGVYFSL